MLQCAGWFGFIKQNMTKSTRIQKRFRAIGQTEQGWVETK